MQPRCGTDGSEASSVVLSKVNDQQIYAAVHVMAAAAERRAANSLTVSNSTWAAELLDGWSRRTPIFRSLARRWRAAQRFLLSAHIFVNRVVRPDEPARRTRRVPAT